MPSLALAFTINDYYTKQLSVVLYSLFKHQMAQTVYDIYVLSNDLSEQSQSQLRAVVEQHSPKQRASIHFLLITAQDLEQIPDFKHLPYGGLWGKEAALRIYLPKYVPNIDRILYLDSDILIMQDLAHLAQVDMHNKAIAGIIDVVYMSQVAMAAPMRTMRIASYLGEDEQGFAKRMQQQWYVNSGVLLMNLNYWREHRFSEQLIELMQRIAPATAQLSYSGIEENSGFNFAMDKHLHPDQDVINYLAMQHQAILHLPLGYNSYASFFPLEGDGQDALSGPRSTLFQRLCFYYAQNSLDATLNLDKDKVYIIHFVGRKPWGSLEGSLSTLYHEYAKAIGWHITKPKVTLKMQLKSMLKAMLPYALVSKRQAAKGYRLVHYWKD